MGRGGTGAKRGSDSSIEITFTYNGVRCRERLPLEPTPANLRKAAQHKAAIDVAIRSGTFDYGATFPTSPRRHDFKPATARQTLSAYLKDYLAEMKDHLKASTWDDYRKTINNVIANSSLAPIPLAELNRTHVKAFIESELKTASNKRIANVLSCVRSALADAVQHTHLPENILVGYSYKRREAPKAREDDDVRPLDAKQQTAILANMQPRFSNHFRFAFWTGLRTSEQAALTWADIDLAAGVVHVTKAQTRSAKAPEATKTKAGRREVKLLKPALEALAAQRAITGKAGPTGRVWQLRTPKAAHAVWTLALQKAGVPHREAYQTRHTYASMMLTAGEPIAWLSAQMGHSNPAYTLKIYARYVPGSNEGAGSAAERMFSVAA